MPSARKMGSFFLLSASSAFGWGCEGHQIITLIARAHLTSAAAASVDRLLRDNPVDPELKRFCQDRPSDPMVDASTWADDVKNTEKTGVWHYVDIPLTVRQKTSLSPWCPAIGPSEAGKDRPGCITNAMDFELSILRDQSRPAAERAKALRYIIHFVGDIQQPLHDSDNNDHGGNCTVMQFFGEERASNLHAVWDYKLIERELVRTRQTQTEYARSLDRRFRNRSDEWSRGAAVDWAWEGHALALDATYGNLRPLIPVENPDPHAECDAERDKVAALHIAIGEDYLHSSLPALEEQLARGGYRLAAVLNGIF
jgi:hypothetical protein